MSTQQEQPKRPTPTGGQSPEVLKRKVDQLSAEVQAHFARLRGEVPK